MIRLTSRQRQALIALAITNVVVLMGVGVLLLRGRSRSDAAFLTMRLDAQNGEACRKAVSQFLFDAGQNSLVHVDENGTLLIEIHRKLITNTLRLDADAATWVAIEAAANEGECRSLKTIHVNVLFSTPHERNSGADSGCRQTLSEVAIGASACTVLRTMARVGVMDVMTWSVGAIDDEELAKRVDYRIPGAALPVTEDAPALP